MKNFILPFILFFLVSCNPQAQNSSSSLLAPQPSPQASQNSLIATNSSLVQAYYSTIGINSLPLHVLQKLQYIANLLVSQCSSQLVADLEIIKVELLKLKDHLELVLSQTQDPTKQAQLLDLIEKVKKLISEIQQKIDDCLSGGSSSGNCSPQQIQSLEDKVTLLNSQILFLENINPVSVEEKNNINFKILILKQMLRSTKDQLHFCATGNQSGVPCTPDVKMALEQELQNAKDLVDELLLEAGQSSSQARKNQIKMMILELNNNIIPDLEQRLSQC